MVNLTKKATAASLGTVAVCVIVIAIVASPLKHMVLGENFSLPFSYSNNSDTPLINGHTLDYWLSINPSINARTLNGHEGLYYLNSVNLTGIISTDRYSAYDDLVDENKISTGDDLISKSQLEAAIEQVKQQSSGGSVTVVSQSDIDSIMAGVGLIGGGNSGDIRLDVVVGEGIVISTNKITAVLGSDIDLMTEVVGVLKVANGGTGLSTAPTDGKFLIGKNGGYGSGSLASGGGLLLNVANGVYTYSLDNTVCRTTGNCAGSGDGIVGSGSAGQLAFFTSENNISSSSGISWDTDNSEFTVIGSINATDYTVNNQALSTSYVVEGSGLYWTTGRFDVAFATKTSDELAEGATNLYLTTTRLDSYLSSKITTAGDILTHDGTNPIRMAKGGEGQCLVSSAVTLVWANCDSSGVGAQNLDSEYVISKTGATYYAKSNASLTEYNNTNLELVLESAASTLSAAGGGTIRFRAGTYDFGTTNAAFNSINNIAFVGAGIDATIIQNSSTAASDTEPLSFTNSNRITVHNLTISAGGSARTSSDALDFDQGNYILVERVKISASRGRGIVADGKEVGATSDRGVIRDSIITGTQDTGISLLSASEWTISGNKIFDVGSHGIQATKASTSAGQPNKKASYNSIISNDINNAGRDGININSSDHNRIIGNHIRNSANIISSRDGMRLESNDSITCDYNIISGNTITDDQGVKTQRYGINTGSANCSSTTISDNYLEGNLTGRLNDPGTNTQYSQHLGGNNILSLSGNVGIGTNAPGTYKLNVNGTALVSGILTVSSYTTNGGLLYTNASGAMAQTAAGTAGQCLQSNGGGAPSWGTCFTIIADSLNFTELSDALILDASTSLVLNAGLTLSTSGSGNVSFGHTGDTAFAGNVGIGPAAASSSLHISNTGSTTLTIEADTDNINEADAPRIVFNQDGGQSYMHIGVEGSSGVAFSDSKTNTGYVMGRAGEGLQFATNNRSRIYIENNGNIGLGSQTNPAGVVHIRGNLNVALTGTVEVTNGSAAVIGTGTDFTTQLKVGDSILLGSNSYSVSAIGSSTDLTINSGYAGPTLAGMTAYMDPDLFAVSFGAGNRTFTIDNTGNVGIGTASPRQSLDVRGNIEMHSVGGTSASGKLVFSDSGSGGAEDSLSFEDYDAINSDNKSTFIFRQDGVDRMLLYGGNLGLGISSANRANITSKLTFTASSVASGGILFGTDTNLYRSGANYLKTDDLFAADSGVVIGAGGTAITKHLSGATTWDPANVTTSNSISTTFTITGAAVGDTTNVGFNQALPDGVIISASVSAADTVKVTLINLSGVDQDLGSGTVRVDIWQH